MPSSTYFAALQGNELAAKVLERFKQFQSDLRSNDTLKRMELSARAYHTEDERGRTGLEISKEGEDEQLRGLKVNHYRANVKNKLAMALAEMPAFVPISKNTDKKSMAQTLVAKGLLDWKMGEGVEDEVRTAMEAAEVMDWAWVDVWWDEKAGEPAQEDGRPVEIPIADEETGEVIDVQRPREGDVAVRMRLATDVGFDLRARGALRWIIVRDHLNKHDVAADLEASGMVDEAERVRGMSAEKGNDADQFIRGTWGGGEEDEIPVYELRHLPCPALPEGVRVRVLAEDLILSGPEPLPYTDLSCYMAMSGKRLGRNHGFSSTPDTLNLQRGIDVLTSIAYSNHQALGSQFIWSPTGDEVTVKKLTKALSHLKSKNEPKGIILAKPNPEALALRQQLITESAQMLGMNPTSMGREEKQMSGVAFALQDTVAQRAVSPTAKAATRLMQQVATAIIRIYRDFAAYSRSIPMKVGKSKVPMVRDFSRDDIDGIERVAVETVSPLMRTPSGRLEIANQVAALKAQNGQPMTAEQLITLIETGRYEPLTEGPAAQMLQIRSENERLAQGEALDSPPPPVDPMTGQPMMDPLAPPPVATAVFTDNHLLHIQEHAAVLASPEARADPAIVANVGDHINAHIRLWRETDPALLASLGIPPPPMPGMMPGDPSMTGAPQPGAESGTPPPKGGGASNTVPGKDAGLPSQPKMPNGESYSPTGAVNG